VFARGLGSSNTTTNTRRTISTVYDEITDEIAGRRRLQQY